MNSLKYAQKPITLQESNFNSVLEMKNLVVILSAMVLLLGCGSNRASEFVESISGYCDYSTVEWDVLRDKYYRPNGADWSAEIDSLIVEEFPMEMACEYWHLLQNARTDFHQRSLPLRAEASRNVIDALNNAEAMFDTVFVLCVSQEYYMRLFPEMYNETMKPAIDNLVEVLNNN